MGNETIHGGLPKIAIKPYFHPQKSIKAAYRPIQAKQDTTPKIDNSSKSSTLAYFASQQQIPHPIKNYQSDIGSHYLNPITNYNALPIQNNYNEQLINPSPEYSKININSFTKISSNTLPVYSNPKNSIPFNIDTALQSQDNEYLWLVDFLFNDQQDENIFFDSINQNSHTTQFNLYTNNEPRFDIPTTHQTPISNSAPIHHIAHPSNLSLVPSITCNKQSEYYNNSLTATLPYFKSIQKTPSLLDTDSNAYLKNTENKTQEMEKIKIIQNSIIEIYTNNLATKDSEKIIKKDILELKTYLENHFNDKNEIYSSNYGIFFEVASNIIWFFIKNWHDSYMNEFINYFEKSSVPLENLTNYVYRVDRLLKEQKYFKTYWKITGESENLYPIKKPNNEHTDKIKKIQEDLIESYYKEKNSLEYIEKTCKQNIIDKNSHAKIKNIIFIYIKNIIINFEKIIKSKNKNAQHDKIIYQIKKYHDIKKMETIERYVHGLFNKIINLEKQNRKKK